ncbi:hypothetical protein [Cohnella cholangitidis]|uniref:Uncharacterized protein n=1 Tax=Cohnella cholangitidis TaxID=2598458 RepID=A0A7G5C2W5_9BACL|nr:hypothetical protein [Cohnella cholangitidis]QMV43549.1 hypothetical protein FPL14_21980 [Cohnella cholangitidis]
MTRNKALWILIATQILFLLFVPVWLFMTGIAVMAIADPNAGEAAIWLVMIYVLLYPVGLLLALILGWIKFAASKFKAALIWNAVPWLWIAPLGGFLIFANS